MSRILFRGFLGLVAGLLAWALVEPTNPGMETSAAWGAFEIHLMLSLGAVTGLTIGLYNAFVQGGRTRFLIGGGLGLFLGLLGALMGYGVGSIVQKMVFGAPIEVLAAQGKLIEVYLSRIVALTPIGTFLGAAIGAASLDWRRLRHGLIGGTIGGATGSMLFDPVAVVFALPIVAAKGTSGAMTEVGQVSRVVFFIVMSGCIALFIGIVEQMAKQASLFLAMGRNEGKEFPLFGPRNAIGRNELAQVPIFTDPAIAPVHAYIDQKGPVYYIVDAGSGAPTFLNGQPVATAPLDHGAVIQVGNTALQFRLKALSRRMPVNQPYTIAQIPQGYGAPAPTGFPAPGMMAPQAAPVYAPAQAIPSSQPTMVVAAQPMPPTLVIMDGPMSGQRYPITSPLEIGREAAGLALRYDGSASRRHASISPGPGGLSVQDLNSTNGTFVNGQRVSTATIRPGDLVKIGATTFRVE